MPGKGLLGRMRILVVEDELHPHGGQERCLLEYTAELAARGHVIDLLYRSPGESLPEYTRFCGSVRQIPGHLLASRDLRSGLLHWLQSARIATSELHDVVYINQHQDSPFGAAVAALQRVPLVCHLHQPPPAGRGLQWRLARRKIARYIAVSHHTRAQYVARGVSPQCIDVVQNGIDLNRYREPDPAQTAAFRRALGIPCDAFVVLYAGRLDIEKGIEVLIEAYETLRIPPAQGRLVIVGAPRNHRDCRAAQEYAASLRRRSSPDNSVWLDWQSDMLPVYGAADLAVLPSLTDEPWGRTTMEAMACRRPALASAVGGSTEVLFGPLERFLFAPANSRALAASITCLRDWRQREPELGEACREHIRQNFSLDRAVDGIESALLRAIHEFGRPP